MLYSKWLNNIVELLEFYVSAESDNYLFEEFVSQIFDDNDIKDFINHPLTEKLLSSLQKET